MSDEDGGPAFPVPQPTRDTEEKENYWDTRGMTLRDWFAGQAFAAMVAGEGALMVADRDERYDETNWAEVVASNAYNFADAMLAARTKKQG